MMNRDAGATRLPAYLPPLPHGCLSVPVSGYLLNRRVYRHAVASQRTALLQHDIFSRELVALRRLENMLAHGGTPDMLSAAGGSDIDGKDVALLMAMTPEQRSARRLQLEALRAMVEEYYQGPASSAGDVPPPAPALSLQLYGVDCPVSSIVLTRWFQLAQSRRRCRGGTEGLIAEGEPAADSTAVGELLRQRLLGLLPSYCLTTVIPEHFAVLEHVSLLVRRSSEAHSDADWTPSDDTDSFTAKPDIAEYVRATQSHSDQKDDECADPDETNTFFSWDFLRGMESHFNGVATRQDRSSTSDAGEGIRTRFGTSIAEDRAYNQHCISAVYDTAMLAEELVVEPLGIGLMTSGNADDKSATANAEGIDCVPTANACSAVLNGMAMSEAAQLFHHGPLRPAKGAGRQLQRPVLLSAAEGTNGGQSYSFSLGEGGSCHVLLVASRAVRDACDRRYRQLLDEYRHRSASGAPAGPLPKMPSLLAQSLLTIIVVLNSRRSVTQLLAPYLPAVQHVGPTTGSSADDVHASTTLLLAALSDAFDKKKEFEGGPAKDQCDGAAGHNVDDLPCKPKYSAPALAPYAFIVGEVSKTAPFHTFFSDTRAAGDGSAQSLGYMWLKHCVESAGGTAAPVSTSMQATDHEDSWGPGQCPIAQRPQRIIKVGASVDDRSSSSAVDEQFPLLPLAPVSGTPARAHQVALLLAQQARTFLINLVTAHLSSYHRHMLGHNSGPWPALSARFSFGDDKGSANQLGDWLHRGYYGLADGHHALPAYTRSIVPLFSALVAPIRLSQLLLGGREGQPLIWRKTAVGAEGRTETGQTYMDEALCQAPIETSMREVRLERYPFLFDLLSDASDGTPLMPLRDALLPLRAACAAQGDASVRYRSFYKDILCRGVVVPNPLYNAHGNRFLLSDDEGEDESDVGALRQPSADSNDFGTQLRTMLEESQARANEQLLLVLKHRDNPEVLQMLKGDRATLTPPNNVLFIRGLNRHTSAEGVADYFNRVLSNYKPVDESATADGKKPDFVVEVEIIADAYGQSACYGFVTFVTDDAATEAYRRLQHPKQPHRASGRLDDKDIVIDFCHSLTSARRRRQLLAGDPASGEGSHAQTSDASRDGTSSNTNIEGHSNAIHAVRARMHERRAALKRSRE